MSNVLGNSIGSLLNEELSAGVYIGGREINGLTCYYLVVIEGESPFLSIGRIVSLPTLIEYNTSLCNRRLEVDTRDIMLVEKIYDTITQLV